MRVPENNDYSYDSTQICTAAADSIHNTDDPAKALLLALDTMATMTTTTATTTTATSTTTMIDGYNTSAMDGSSLNAINYPLGYYPIPASDENFKPGLLRRIARRFALVSYNFFIYIQSQFNEHTATSIASFSVLIIVLSIICCFIISLMREEERKIKEQYKKLSAGSSQSFVASAANYSPGGYQKISNQHYGNNLANYHPTSGPNYASTEHQQPASPSVARSGSHKLHVIELRRETYFGLVRLLKPGCRTIVLLCDTQSRIKLLTKFYQCIYPYRKNKALQFAFLLIEKNIGWYEDVLKLALNERRDLHINPINCIGTVLVLNGFKKYFSVYHASDSRSEPDEPFVLLEESLLDSLSDWLERLFAGKASRYYVKYWPDKMR